MGICYVTQETQTGVLYQPREVGWRERWERVSKGRGYMYTYGWFMLGFNRKQNKTNSVKQLSLNKKIKNRKGNPLTLLVGIQLVQSLWRTVWRFLRKLEPPYSSVIPLLGICSREKHGLKGYIHLSLHSSTIYNGYDHWQMNEWRSVVHIYPGIFQSY